MRRLPAIVVTVILLILFVVIVATAIVARPASSTAASAPATPSQRPSPSQAATPSPGATPSAGPTSQAPAPSAAQVSVAFFGDGYTSGSPAGGQGQANYTAILSGRDGWMITNDSVYGSGYVAGAALPTRLDKIVAARPQLVVVTAGRADDQSDPTAVGTAARQLYQDLRTKLPQAKIVVIGPMWLGNDVPPRMLAVRDAIRDAATGAKLPFVDPIADRWFIGSDQDGIAPGNEIINDKGHQRLAQLVDDAVKRSGVLPK